MPRTPFICGGAPRTPDAPKIDLHASPPSLPSPLAIPPSGAWERHRPRGPRPDVLPLPAAAEGSGGAGAVAERGPALRPSEGTIGRTTATAGPEPVRLVAPTAVSPFAPGREVAFARVDGNLLAGFGVRDGDHVALWRRDVAEPGDLAAVLDATGRAGLWRVYPERDELRLTTGDPACARRSGRRPRVQGVVVAVHRSFGARIAAPRATSPKRARPGP